MTDHADHHSHRLADDLKVMEAMIVRRRALKWFAGAGTAALVAGCGGSGSGTSSAVAVTSTGTTTTSSPTPTPTPSATPTPTPTATTSSACIVDPTETAGPYPADGTNTSSGSTSNVLTSSGIVRSDIRSSFISTITVATGTMVKLTLTLVNVNASCAPLAGYAIYLWHCDRNGNYSLYGGAASESYLRGVQVTDANGQVSFTTIFPAAYSGRWPHMHFEVFSSLANAPGGRYAVLTSQLAMPSAIGIEVFADTTLYPSSAANVRSITLANDGVFGDNSAAQLAQQTPVFSGSPSAGYTATALIGIAR